MLRDYRCYFCSIFLLVTWSGIKIGIALSQFTNLFIFRNKRFHPDCRLLLTTRRFQQYGDIYNFPQLAFDKALEDGEIESDEAEGEEEEDIEEAIDKTSEMELGKEELERVFIAAEDFEESDASDIEDKEEIKELSEEENEMEEDIEIVPSTISKRLTRSSRKGQIEIEYEMGSEHRTKERNPKLV